MTLKEIAKEAGVAVSTVSRVINKKSTNVASKEVQDKIWEIVRRTGYTPNSSARSLKCGTSPALTAAPGSIACLFARTDDPISDPTFSIMARSIEKEAFKHNYVIKYSFHVSDIQDASTFTQIANEQVDGVVILGRCDHQVYHLLKKHFTCIVYIGLNQLDAKLDQVICDGYEAAQSAMSHLLALGHRRIAYIGETRSEARHNGYRIALANSNIPLNPSIIINVPLSSGSEGGYQGTRKLLQNRADITAIYCINDLTAIGAIRAIKEAGLRIPEDISVISIDDIATSQYISPMLTTIHIPVEAMGQMTAKVLIDRIESGHSLPMVVKLPFYMAHRESCGPCKHT